MNRPWPQLMPLALAFLLAPWGLLAQEPAASEAPTADEETAKVEDVIVVTASRSEQRLQEAPATMTVITGEDLEREPADDYGDVLRNVPGLNVSQMSARDIQVTGRSSTNSLAASELVLLDGRTVYLDFFGFVMWDLLPINPREIKQIEVVRGPGSAVWGANALSGVINLITKTPREAAGTSLQLGGGELGTLFGSLSHAGAAEHAAYKISAAYYEQDPYERPTGNVPGTNTPYPSFKNGGTAQPKVDFRLDFDGDPSSVWTLGAGYAATDGIIHSGIGPFDIDKGTAFSYAKLGWTKNAFRLNAFVNVLDGEADNLLTRGLDGKPIKLGFKSDTYNVDASNVSLLGTHHVLTYGGNARHLTFDLTIAPEGKDRDEYGVFLQDEILIGNSVRWLVGGRYDDLDPIGGVFSPRTSLMISPNPNHTVRLSFNRAFKSPSQIQNYLNVTIVNLVNLPTGPYIFPSLAIGNPNLQEERLDAYEIGYVGSFGHTTFTLAAYRNETKDSQDFYTAATYTAANPPPGFPLPAFVLAVPPPQGLAGLLPSRFSYRNIGKWVDKGVETSLSWRSGSPWSWNFNYSYQADPDVTGIPQDEVNLPPRHRLNGSISYNGMRFFTNLNANYQDKAVWTDVLDSRFHGPTDAFTQINATVGYRFTDTFTFSVIGNNIFDERVQQHVFGDIISRKIIAQVLWDF